MPVAAFVVVVGKNDFVAQWAEESSGALLLSGKMQKIPKGSMCRNYQGCVSFGKMRRERVTTD